MYSNNKRERQDCTTEHFTVDHQIQHLAGSLVVFQRHVKAELLEVGEQARRILIGATAFIHPRFLLKRPVVDDYEPASLTVVHAVLVPCVSIIPSTDECSTTTPTTQCHPGHIMPRQPRIYVLIHSTYSK